MSSDDRKHCTTPPPSAPFAAAVPLAPPASSGAAHRRSLASACASSARNASSEYSSGTGYASNPARSRATFCRRGTAEEPRHREASSMKGSSPHEASVSAVLCGPGSLSPGVFSRCRLFWNHTWIRRGSTSSSSAIRFLLSGEGNRLRENSRSSISFAGPSIFHRAEASGPSRSRTVIARNTLCAPPFPGAGAGVSSLDDKRKETRNWAQSDSEILDFRGADADLDPPRP